MKALACALAAVWVVGALPALPAQTAKAPKRPHIVVIVSDDAGYADFSMHGSRQIATPRIDSIAAGGVRLRQGYVSASVCSPSRAGLMTGRYQQRFGHEQNIPPRFSEENGLPRDERTIADELRAAGYRTVALGKWHLGYADHFHPLSRGFTDYFGFLQGARSYLPLAEPTRLNRLLRDREVQGESFDYMTDELGRQAAKYIEERGDQPLFLYLAFNAVHTPMQATDADLAAAKGQGRRQKLVAMTHALDRAVGLVLDALDREGIADDTLLFFLNDNGGATNNASRNAPLRGQKGSPFEGGVRVPFAVRWPARLPKGRVYDYPVIALDVLPTCLAAAGVAREGGKPLDGVDVLPFLAGERDGAPHDALFWRRGDNWAIREGHWKLLSVGGGAPMLFHIGDDEGEQDDRCEHETERVEAMRARFDEWSAELVEPLWPK